MQPTIDPALHCRDRLDALRAELADRAFVLESRGRLDAADVANEIAGRVAAIRAELAGSADEALTPTCADACEQPTGA
jgi:hypothetical protein